MTENRNDPTTAHDLLAQLEAARKLTVRSRGTRNGEHQDYSVLVLSDEAIDTSREIQLVANGHYLTVLIHAVGAGNTRNLIDVFSDDRRVASGVEVQNASGLMASSHQRNGGDVVDFSAPDAHITLAVQYGLPALGYL